MAGNLTGGPGSIWVWAEDLPHYKQSSQFALMSGGTHTGLNAFRNARTDNDTDNPLSTTPKYLYGIERDGKVYWSGSVILGVTKTVTGAMGDKSAAFPFTVSGLTNGKTYEFERFSSTDGTTWTKVSDGSLTAADGKISFSLKHYEKIEIAVPGGTSVTVSEENGQYRASYAIDGGSSTAGNTASGIVMDDDRIAAFTNDLPPVAPTGISISLIPFIWILILGTLLAMTALPIRRRRRGEMTE